MNAKRGTHCATQGSARLEGIVVITFPAIFGCEIAFVSELAMTTNWLCEYSAQIRRGRTLHQADAQGCSKKEITSNEASIRVTEATRYDAQARVLNREFRLESPGLGEKSKPRGKQYGVQEKVIDLQVAEASLLEACEALEKRRRHRSGQWRSK